MGIQIQHIRKFGRFLVFVFAKISFCSPHSAPHPQMCTFESSREWSGSCIAALMIILLKKEYWHKREQV